METVTLIQVQHRKYPSFYHRLTPFLAIMSEGLLFYGYLSIQITFLGCCGDILSTSRPHIEFGIQGITANVMEQCP